LAGIIAPFNAILGRDESRFSPFAGRAPHNSP
jgi:hypothetical protein